jgi:hypothetical protein
LVPADIDAIAATVSPVFWCAASPSIVTTLVTTGFPSASVTSLRISASTVPWDSITESR